MLSALTSKAPGAINSIAIRAASWPLGARWPARPDGRGRRPAAAVCALRASGIRLLSCAFQQFGHGIAGGHAIPIRVRQVVDEESLEVARSRLCHDPLEFFRCTVPSWLNANNSRRCQVVVIIDQCPVALAAQRRLDKVHCEHLELGRLVPHDGWVQVALRRNKRCCGHTSARMAEHCPPAMGRRN